MITKITRRQLRQLIKEAIRQTEPGYHMSYVPDTKGIIYTALVLDPESHQALTQFVPEGWKTYAHHMTLISPPMQKGSRLPQHFLNQQATIVIDKIAQNDQVIAGVVNVQLSDNLPIKGPTFPHVTICTNPMTKGKPFMSNQLNLATAQSIEPIVLTGTIQEILR